MNTIKSFEIMDGPSRDALFDACKYAYDKKSHIEIDFSVAFGYTQPVEHPGSAHIKMRIKDIQITGISHEDGCGQKLNFYGFCLADIVNPFSGPDYVSYAFKAYYDTAKRKGWIEFSR